MTCERAYGFARDDVYREWAYTTMTRARSASRLYVVAERATERDEFAPTEPARDARVAVAAALSRSDERRFASEHIERRPDRTVGIDRSGGRFAVVQDRRLRLPSIRFRHRTRGGCWAAGGFVSRV